MWDALEPAIIIFSLGLAAAGIILALRLAIGLPRKALRRQEEESSGEEARMIQDMFTKLNRLEVRIESLETIIVETQRKPR
ncbi:MAG: hypothetical protein JW942_10025 [Opitutales bacterium]|nr:hypothetical protein [Opitutales bacterium]